MKKPLNNRVNLKQTYVPKDVEIRRLRLSADITQAEAGDSIGVASATWSRYETGIDVMPPAKWRHFTLEVGLLLSDPAYREKVKKRPEGDISMEQLIEEWTPHHE